jgi:tape measure domain-containing protein
MAERKVTIAIDIVQSGNGSTKVKAALGGVEREVKASQKRISDSAKATNKIIEESDKAQARIKKIVAKQQADEFIRELKRVENERKRIEHQAKSAAGGGLFGAVFGGALAASAVSSLTSQLSTAGRAVFDFSSRMEQTKIGFTSLMGNARLATDHLKELQKLTTEFPLEFTSIAKMSQRLQGAGFEARKIIPLIKDIGNVAAATGDLSAERMEGIGVALSQIASKGRVSAEEMEQLAERGIPAWRILSESIGKTAAATRKMAEDGKISSTQLFEAFQRFSRLNFGDAMKRQAGTFSGAMQQIKNILMLTASTAFEPLYKEISSIAVKASKDIQKQKNDFNAIGQTIGEAIGKGIGLGVGVAIREIGKELGKMGWGVSSFQAGLFGLGKGTVQGIGGLSAPGQVGNIIPDYTRPDYTKKAAKPEDDEKWKDSLAGIATILTQMREGTMMQESGGKQRARNRRTDASGLFQVMPANIGPWTQDVFGQAMSQNDFLSSSQAQEAVFNHVMGQYLETAMRLSGGNKDVAIRMAAAAWYGGPGAMKRYDDPRRFRSNEPSFREYTTSVLKKTQVAKLGDTIGISDVQDELAAKMSHRSDINTENSRRILAIQAIQAYKEAGILPSDEMVSTFREMMVEDSRRQGIAQPTNEQIQALIYGPGGRPGPRNFEVQGRGDLIKANEKIIERNKELISEYERLDDAIFNSIDRTEEEIITRRIAQGFIKDLTEEEKGLLIVRAQQVDAAKREADRKREQEDFDKRVLSEIENLKRDEYEKTRDVISESLDYLSRGDFKGLAKSFIERQRRAFVEKGTDFILEKLGIENPNDTPELKEAKRQTQLLKQIAIGVGQPGTTGVGGTISGTLNTLFGGGGGTPNFNPSAGGGAGGGLGGILGNLFGGGGGGGGSNPLNGPLLQLSPASGGKSGGMLGGLTGAGGMFGPMKNLLTGNMSAMGGMMGGIGSIATIAGGAIGGKWGNLISMAGMGAQIGANFGPWGAAIGAAAGGVAGLIMALMGGDNSLKKLKEAALSTYGITVKDKSVLKALKNLGESMFGKGQAGKNASAVVSSDQGQNILRNYAEATGQSTKMIDRLYYGDENWSGNQFRGGFSGFNAPGMTGTSGTKFGGFRAMGGPVTRGYSYVVGERGPEVFTPRGAGSISPTVGMGDQQMRVVLGQLEETVHILATRLQSLSAGQVLTMGAAENPNAIGDAVSEQMATRQDINDQIARGTGRAW